MDYASYFPIWDKLTPQQQNAIAGVIEYRSVKRAPTSTTAALNAWV